jgi:hypothetical protein
LSFRHEKEDYQKKQPRVLKILQRTQY